MLVSMGRAGFGILAACLFVCLEGSFWSGSAQNTEASQVALVVSIAFMLVVGLSATAGPRRVSLSFLYRWMCPALVMASPRSSSSATARGRMWLTWWPSLRASRSA
ncbi:hypothetical protein [Eggerthella sinensis]|uniref:hypothetical protein n=1 Tax=Eggerthella sinensis TaxID=242230 RepID=UPI003A4D6271